MHYLIIIIWYYLSNYQKNRNIWLCYIYVAHLYCIPKRSNISTTVEYETIFVLIGLNWYGMVKQTEPFGPVVKKKQLNVLLKKVLVYCRS